MNTWNAVAIGDDAAFCDKTATRRQYVEHAGASLWFWLTRVLHQLKPYHTLNKVKSSRRFISYYTCFTHVLGVSAVDFPNRRVESRNRPSSALGGRTADGLLGAERLQPATVCASSWWITRGERQLEMCVMDDDVDRISQPFLVPATSETNRHKKTLFHTKRFSQPERKRLPGYTKKTFSLEMRNE